METKQELLTRLFIEETLKSGMSNEEANDLIPLIINSKEDLISKYEKQAIQYLNSVQDKEEQKKTFNDLLMFGKQFRKQDNKKTVHDYN